MNIRQLLDDRLTAALHVLGAPPTISAIVKPSARPEFGDYQANGVMAAAKQLKTNPRELATRLLASMDLSDLADKVEIAGPGFINIHLKNAWIAATVEHVAKQSVVSQRTGCQRPGRRATPGWQRGATPNGGD